MPEMIMHRNKTVACLSGHVIAFVKGEPTHVPPPAIQECMAAGAIPTEDLPQEPETEATKAPQDPEERKAKIFAAFDALRKKNQRGDFDAAGKPQAKVVSESVGFIVEAKERNVMWNAYMEAAQE